MKQDYANENHVEHNALDEEVIEYLHYNPTKAEEELGEIYFAALEQLNDE